MIEDSLWNAWSLYNKSGRISEQLEFRRGIATTICVEKPAAEARRPKQAISSGISNTLSDVLKYDFLDHLLLDTSEKM